MSHARAPRGEIQVRRGLEEGRQRLETNMISSTMRSVFVNIKGLYAVYFLFVAVWKILYFLLHAEIVTAIIIVTVTEDEFIWVSFDILMIGRYSLIV